jgi:hypothetical protein
MSYRPKYEDTDGSLVDLPIEAETTVKLKTARSIGLSGVTATAKSFDGTSAITIPITAIPATLLTGTASIDTTGEAGSAKNYNTSEGTIKDKFNSLDSSISSINALLDNIGKLNISGTYYSARVTNDTNDKGQEGYLTFII